MLWRVCIFALHARLSLRLRTKISWVGANDDLCPISTSSEGSGESAPENTIRVCNHQCLRTDSSRNHLVPKLILPAYICPRFCSSQRPFQAAIAHANGW